MRLIVVTALLALVCAGGLVFMASSQTFDQRLVSLEAQRLLPSEADALADESPALNAVFLEMAGDPPLWMNARLAILAYGDAARGALIDYAREPQFQQVLKRYGADAMLPILYYRENDMVSVRIGHWLSQRSQQIQTSITHWWQSDTPSETTAPADPERSLTPIVRGRIAIAALDEKGHDLLREFVATPQGRITRIQSERLVSDISDLFTSGVRGLERKWRGGETVGAVDVGWAAADVLVMASAVKVLRAARLARSGRVAKANALPVLSKGALAGRRLAVLSRGAKVAAVAATGYLIVRHPSLISALGANIARWTGLPEWLGQFGIWVVVLWPLLIAGLLVYRWVLAPCLWLLVILLKTTSNAPRRLTGRTSASRV